MVASWSVLSPKPVTDHYEWVVCDLCGQSGGQPLDFIRNVSDVAEPVQRYCLEGLDFPATGVSLVRCPVCGFGYQNPRLSPLGLQVFYDRFYDPSMPATAYYRLSLPKLDAARYEAISSTGRTEGTVLDVGAGNGDALAAFPAAQWERHGLDVSPQALTTLQERVPGVIAHQGTLPTAGLPGSSFDVVTMNSTLEHVRDPVDALVESVRLLRPDGLLVFNVPNLGCPSRLVAAASRQHWIGFTPEHLNYFTVGVLKRLHQRVGFRRACHHTVGYGEARDRWAHLGAQVVRLASGTRRIVQRRPEGIIRVVAGLGIIMDWPTSATPLGRWIRCGENITGFWTR